MAESEVDRVELEASERVAPALYVNEASITANVYDFVLAFGRKSPDQSEPVVNLHMSPQHAVSLLLLLERQVRQYEKQVGVINLPESLRSRLRGDEMPDEQEEREVS